MTKTELFLMFTRAQARKSGMAEMEQPVDGPFGAVPPVRPPLEAAGKLESSPAEPAGPAPVPATSRVIPTNEDGFGGGPESFPRGVSLRCPGGQTGPKPSIEEMPRPPSEQGTSSLPGLATQWRPYRWCKWCGAPGPTTLGGLPARTR